MRYLIAFVVVALVYFIALPKLALATTYTVSKTADTNDGTCDADCSLREAVVAANANSGLDTINFNIPTSDSGYNTANGGYWTFSPSGNSNNYTLTDSAGVFINGYSQTGSSRNTAVFGQEDNAVITIRINYTSTAGSIYAFALTAGNNHIAGLNIDRNTTGAISIASDGNWIEGNFMGTDITGTLGSGFSHVDLTSGNNNIIGTNGDGSGDPGERNIITGSCSQRCISIGGTNDNNVVAGNYVGVNKTGRVCPAVGTRTRAIIQSATNTNERVGTNYDGVSDSEEANIFACVNSDARGVVRYFNGVGGVLQGNYIGTNPRGDTLSDFSVFGVVFRDTATNVGGLIKGNIIANNFGGGIVSLLSVYRGETFSRNLIYNNGGQMGIDLGNDGITANDPGDSDTNGGNNGMNYPEITTAEYVGGSKYRLRGTMDSAPGERPITIEVFKSDGQSNLHGGAIAYLGAVNPLPNGTWEAIVDVPGEENTRRVYFTTTATNVNGDTSEFSLNAFVGGSDTQTTTTSTATPISTKTPTPKPIRKTTSLVNSPTPTPEPEPTPVQETQIENKGEEKVPAKFEFKWQYLLGILVIPVVLLLINELKRRV